MNILWIYNHKLKREYDCWLHLEFAKRIADYYNINIYGTNVHFHYPDLCLVQWHKDVTLEKIRQKYPFDVIIADTKNRMFDSYRPSLYPYDDRPEERGESLLPPDFAENRYPKLCLEEDYQYESDTSWYVDMNFDVLLHRHHSNWLRTKNDPEIKTEWFPFSVDTDIFRPDYTIPRKNKVLFAMNYEHEVYKDRRKVRHELDISGLLTNAGIRLQFDDYIEALQSHDAAINASGLYEITPAKIFEIIASGAALLTDDSEKTGVDFLFPDTTVKYKKDGSNVVDVAASLLYDKERIKFLSNQGLQMIHDRHSHQKRIKDLMKILYKYELSRK